MIKGFVKISLITVLIVVFAGAYVPRLSAQEDDASSPDVIDMVAGDIQSMTANNLVRVSVTNPEVADISDAQTNKVSLVAKRAGSTVLFFWDADGKHSVRIRVANEDLTALKARIQKILDEANIQGVSLETNFDIGKVVLSGSLSKEDKYRLEDVLQPYSDNLVNFVKEEKNEDLIQVDMQIVEINTSLEQNLGILWGNATSNTGTNGAAGNASQQNNGQVNLNYNEKLPTMNGHIEDFFKIGKFYRTSPLEATVNALLNEGKARLISKPRLVVVSGKQASFLVGGEIPIQSTTTNTTGSTLTSNTSYSQYGVNLSVTPTIKDGKIDVLLNVDIRDVDAATPITSGSNSNVAFITRSASTDLLMDNKQTIALAGLIKYQDSVNETEVPFLSKVPILGLLFRNKASPADSNTEMVIILTPTVLTEKKFAQKQIVMPTPEEKNAWGQIIESGRYEHEPVVSNWPAPKAVKAGPDVPMTSYDSGSLSAVAAYARGVQEKISRSVFYPSQAVTGTVKLKLAILKDGSLDSEEIIESSGSNLLDQDAMQAAKTAAPYSAFSSGMEQDKLVFTIPIVYNK